MFIYFNVSYTIEKLKPASSQFLSMCLSVTLVDLLSYAFHRKTSASIALKISLSVRLTVKGLRYFQVWN